MFFVILLGAALIAAGIGVTFGGAWATIGAVVLLAVGIKVFLMGTAFGFFRRRARARWHRSWGPEGEGERGPWPCGGHRRHLRDRMDEWHEEAHAGAPGGARASGEGEPAAE